MTLSCSSSFKQCIFMYIAWVGGYRITFGIKKDEENLTCQDL